MKVLYEDNHVIAVWKEARIPVQGDESGDVCLMDMVKEYLKEKYQKPGAVFLGLIHRLDRPVAGIVIFGKTSKGASRLSEQFRMHAVKKIYHALVEGKLEKPKGTLINYLLKDTEKNFVTVYDTPYRDAKIAELSYKVIGTKGEHTIVEIELQTGRSHQIRAQFAHIGHPLVGDHKYGSKASYQAGALALAAVRLEFDQPVSGERIVITEFVDFN
ncbi:MAG TPA: RluA family pseudouridine synthase [Candidatus Magasanikbacteria bacterium]|nr:RluA family pseudouridine synthase [Candidatus Magasanikbacteria bacterium]